MTHTKPPFAHQSPGRPTIAPPLPTMAPSQKHMTAEQALEQAITQFGAKNFHEADVLCTAILEVQPGNIYALNLMGLIALAVDKAKIALEYFKKARKADPNESAYHFNAGLAAAALGREKMTEKFYRQALELKPDYGEAVDNLGLLLAKRGHLEEAVELHRRAIDLMPDAFGPSINLAVTLKSLGRRDEMLEILETANTRHPDTPEVHLMLARLLSDLGRTDEAEKKLRAVIRLTPDDWRPYSGLGLLMSACGETDEALRLLRKAVDRAPEEFSTQYNLGFVFFGAAAYGEAMTVLRQALKIDPNSKMAWALWSECLFQTETITLDDQLIEELASYLERDDASPGKVAVTLKSLLERDRALASLRLMADTGDIRALAAELASGKGIQALNHPLLSPFMRSSSIGGVAIERLLTGIRRAFLHLHETGQLGKVVTAHNGFRFLSALAGHCFLNEYVFHLREEEEVCVQNLENNIASLIETGTTLDPAEVALLACYRPLHRIKGGERLAEMKKLARHPFIGETLRRQIEEPLAEGLIRKKIPQLTKVNDAVSVKVRDQYEQNPYPRWHNASFVLRKNLRSRLLHDIPGMRNINTVTWPENPRILVAGCGSGQHPLQSALSYEGASVLGVDLSLSSLAYGERKRREQNVENLKLAQADILEMKDWPERFDMVECVGVLHHLKNPLKGWKILVGLLKPGGLMQVGLYSETGRRAIVAARAFIAKKGYKPTPDDIRRCRQDILALPKSHPALSATTLYGDFNSISTCRDLLFHVQEHRFTIPEIAHALKELDLELLGFSLQSRKAAAEYRARFPEDPAMSDLENWEHFEQDNPDTFKSMYQFWVRKRG